MIPYAMLYTVVAGWPILIAALALSAVLRRYGRAERGVWLVALVLAHVLPAFALLEPFGRAGAASPPLAPEIGVIGLPSVIAVPVEPSSFDLGGLLLLAWMVASTVLALRWMVAAYRLARAARSWHPAMIDGMNVWTTEDVGPAVSGVFCPRVLAPSWLHTLPSRERSLILLHEQEHVRARDPLLIALTRVATILVPWNPMAWALSSRLVRAVELDCDRRVLRRTTDVRAYGNTLLAASSRRPGRLLAAAAFAESEAPLRTRILAMTTPPRTVSVFAILASMVLGVVLLVGVLEIPVPAIRIQVQVDPAPDAPGVAEFPAFKPSSTPPKLLNEEEIQRVGQLELSKATESWERALVRPSFTPVSVRPSLLNRDQVHQALLAAYPATLRDEGIGGRTNLRLHINAQGNVSDARVQASSGYTALDEAALSVARTMRFSPARNRDQHVPVWIEVPVSFQVVQ